MPVLEPSQVIVAGSGPSTLLKSVKISQINRRDYQSIY